MAKKQFNLDNLFMDVVKPETQTVTVKPEEVKQEVAEQVEKVATVVEEAQPIVVTAPIQKEAESFEVIYEQPKEQKLR